MEAEARTHPGMVRQGNEDAYLARVELGLFAVADGLGGHLAGEVASWLAIRTVEERLSRHPSARPLEALKNAMLEANRQVFLEGRNSADRRGMGTTLTVAWLRDAHLYLGHVGDSSAYHFREGRLRKLTRDHSLAEEMSRLGGIAPEATRFHPQRHILTRAVGTEPEVAVDTLVLPLEAGDLLLLCTDGLSSLVSPSELEGVLQTTTALAPSLDRLLDLALARGAPDNVTAVLVRYE
ncbi:MAG: Stp1/IreP family PP2C-type Ser/Thr phosphatase [Moorellales bacterium]